MDIFRKLFVSFQGKQSPSNPKPSSNNDDTDLTFSGLTAKQREQIPDTFMGKAGNCDAYDHQNYTYDNN